MTTLSDLPEELKAEILARVPITSLSVVRSTCKKWNASSKNRIFGKEAALERKQFLGFMMMDYSVCSLRFDLHGIRNDGDFVDPSIKRIRKLNHVEISQVFHCDGLLLCVVIEEYRSRLMVWNPYLGQTKWIEPINKFHREDRDRFALGYDNNNNRNHKILRFLNEDEYYKRSGGFWFETYDFSSNSWRTLDAKPGWFIPFTRNYCVSLKGNIYFFAQEKIDGGEINSRFLISFDCTAERFGPRLPLSFHCDSINLSETMMTLSCVRDEQLAVLYQQHYVVFQIWVTTKIEPNEVSWSKFLKLDITTLNNGSPKYFCPGSFFVDEEKNVVVVFDACGYYSRQGAYIIGEDGYFKSVNIEEAPKKPGKTPKYRYCFPLGISSYVPSLVQLNSNDNSGAKGNKETIN